MSALLEALKAEGRETIAMLKMEIVEQLIEPVLGRNCPCGKLRSNWFYAEKIDDPLTGIESIDPIEDDECIAGLPKVIFACCGHFMPVDRRYVSFRITRSPLPPSLLKEILGVNQDPSRDVGFVTLYGAPAAQAFDELQFWHGSKK